MLIRYKILLNSTGHQYYLMLINKFAHWCLMSPNNLEERHRKDAACPAAAFHRQHLTLSSASARAYRSHVVMCYFIESENNSKFLEALVLQPSDYCGV